MLLLLAESSARVKKCRDSPWGTPLREAAGRTRCLAQLCGRLAFRLDGERSWR